MVLELGTPQRLVVSEKYFKRLKGDHRESNDCGSWM